MANNNQDKFTVRPSGRHLLTIGRELIQDNYAAIVELVKNAYDADASQVNLLFEGKDDGSFEISITDDGHGMDRDTVANKWLVPSTDDKKLRKNSPSGRRMQGRKGIGRYAAAILGRDMLLRTTMDSVTTTVYVEWVNFEKAQYLDEVEVLVESLESELPRGTELIVTGDSELRSLWDTKQFDRLRFELKKMMPTGTGGKDKAGFKIHLKTVNFHHDSLTGDFNELIEPFPIIDFFDYRIHGVVATNGKAKLVFENQKARNTVSEDIVADFGPTNCGCLKFDIRVFDREAAAIEHLIHRGLKTKDGSYIGRNQARSLLNELNGISVVRHGFRIRPLGDPNFDWLELNKLRVQNPSRKIGSNQAIGHVEIDAEEESGLFETSARDGLRANLPFSRLIEITQKVIVDVEKRRFLFRKQQGLGRKTAKIEKDLEQLFLFENLSVDISKTLLKNKVSKTTIEEIVELIQRDATEKNKIADVIKQTVAIYQGQATLGKIVNVILHEGRKPLSFFRNEIPNLNFYAQKLTDEYEPAIFEKLLPVAVGLGINAKLLVELFGRLDPLAAKSRSKRKFFSAKKMAEQAQLVFRKTLVDNGIELLICGDKKVELKGWQQDLFTIFINLIENSIYWIREKGESDGQIQISINSNKGQLDSIDIKDTGTGIEPKLLDNDAIFDPEFSTKPGGSTGLGLAISGEAATRLGLKLEAIDYDTGAYFRLTNVDQIGDE